LWPDAGHKGHPRLGYAGPHLGAVAVAGIHRHHLAGKPGRVRETDVIERDPAIGLL
jgi:hypothetical protein